MKKLPYSFLLVIALFFLFPLSVSAQVVINEFSSFDSPDWIELLNTTSDEVNLNGWKITDVGTSTPVYSFDSDIILPANGHCAQDVSVRLNKDGDRILLLNGTTEIDCVSYGTGRGEFCSGGVADVVAPASEETATRVTEGTESWVIGSSTKSTTPCESLGPTPTSTAEPTSVPTDEPTSEPTTVATSAPTPSPSPTVIGKKTTRPRSTKKPSDDERGEDMVIGLREGLKTPEATEEAEMTKGKMSWGAIVFIIVGIGFIGLAGYTFYTQKEKGQTDEKPEKKVE